MKNTFRSIVLITTFCTITNILTAQWVQMNNIPYYYNVSALAVSGTNLFVSMYYWVGADAILTGVAYFSTNDGTSWAKVDSGLMNLKVNSFTFSGVNLFVGIYGAGVFLSTNNGTSWTGVNIGLTSTYVNSLTSMGKNLFAGTYDAGVFLSTNNGASWTSVNSGLPAPSNIQCFAFNGTNLFAGTLFNGVYTSTNNGTSWTPINSGLPDNSYVQCLTVSGANLFAVIVGGGVFLSTNNGTSWINVGLTNTAIYSLAVSGTNIFVGSSGTIGNIGSEVFLSTNNGTSWTTVDSGLPGYPSAVEALSISRTSLFAGTPNGVWRRPLSEMVTAVNETSSSMPTQFTLGQNYPNPFNPVTNISFNLPIRSFVSLKIFDLMGREVTTLISEKLSTGSYSKQWNASGLPSGIYFYRLQAGSLTETKKLVLLR
jgi:photosystem II stability/assembly factor-like uncharacterized protein